MKAEIAEQVITKHAIMSVDSALDMDVHQDFCFLDQKALRLGEQTVSFER